ncbi:MAG: stage II sporulation protein E [Clostridia bacterium]|nr:stage II sporulation protein E [Clostridia bacterium]
MAETEVYTYEENVRRKKAGKVRFLQGIEIKISKQDVFSGCIGFFLAMAMPLPGMAPFGMAYLAQERKLSLKAVLSFILVSLGTMAVCDRLGSAKYISAGIIYLCVLFVLEKGIRINDVAAGVIAGVSILATGIAALIIEGVTFLGVILLLCEAAVVVSGTLMMEKSIQALKRKEFLPGELDGDTKLSMAAVILVALLSLKEIYLGTAFSVMNCVAAALLLVVAAGCGAGYSTGMGVLLGVVCGIGGDFFMPVLGAFSFCGFLAGAFSRFGKGGAIAGIILANGIMVVYTNSAVESVLSLYEILASAVIFSFIPKAWVEWVKTAVCIDENDRESIVKIKEGLRARICSVAAAFESMSKTMEKLSDKENKAEDSDVAALFDETADKVCAKCRKSAVCWGQNFNSTYDEMFHILNALREKGVVRPEDVSEHFAAKCLNIGGFLEELNHRFDIYRVRQVWRSKLTESRRLVGKQLGGMSEILENLTTEIDGKTQKSMASAWEIRSRLEISGIKPRDVNIMQDKYGRCRVEVVMKANKCQGKQRRSIEKIMKAVAGVSVMSREEVLEDKKLVRLVFSEAERYEVETEHASKAASEKNGDNFRFLHLENGKFIIAISDGMGTGRRAAKESEAILELLDSFLQAGFDSKIAVRLINSIMIMKSEDEAFVTLDLCIIDLYTGEVKFIKTGAEPSFISNSNGRVRTVRANSLPVGLIAEAEAEVSNTKVKDGDRIVMITDGIESRDSGSLWVSEFIRESGEKCEKGELAGEILNRAVEKNGGTVKDDMTVLSVKLKAVG